MQNNLPFIIPENDINLRLSRFLLIIDILAYTQRGKLVLNIDKLIIFDFLVKNPYILKQVLKVKGKTKIKLYKEEIGSVATLYPSKNAILDTNSSKILIKLMVLRKMVVVNKQSDELFFTLSDQGKALISEIKTDYIDRIKELCESMLVLRSISTNELKKIINPLIKGV
ncbi:hypothetical protein GKZ28_24985 [Clostridium chromiireducens]|uniref:Uncharacterized protein n=1 Tax=Clostridium chromiireducens TaxID=225345 RepID=A0A964RSB1_9CLOT|nr:ABC-three component system middle component 4 [Clostridium chromiireducens]MVX66917.1 hypothetical protein [Clostridium chromiireducens]